MKILTDQGIKEIECLAVETINGHEFGLNPSRTAATHIKSGFKFSLLPGRASVDTFRKLIMHVVESNGADYFWQTIVAMPDINESAEKIEKIGYAGFMASLNLPKKPAPEKVIPKNPKLLELIAQFGYDDLSVAISENAMSSLVPGICMNPGCEYTTDVEPDQGKGFCEVCNTRSVKSILEFNEV